LPTKGIIGSRQVRWPEYLARLGEHTRTEKYSGRFEQDALFAPVCDQPDAGAEPSGETSAGSRIRWKRKREAKRDLPDEEPVASSRSNRFGQTDVARVSEGAQVPEGTIEQGGEPSVTPNKEIETLDVRQKANEASFIARIRHASLKYADLTRKDIKERHVERDGLWWKATEEEHLSLYIPRNASSALRQEYIEWVHIHPFNGHVGGDRTTKLFVGKIRLF